VAVKTFKRTNELSPTVINEFFKECSIMRSLSHTNILLFMGACIVPGHYQLVTEIAPNGSLDTLLHKQKNQCLHFSRKIRMAREIAEGMTWLHMQNPPLLHLDLKPANILLMEDYTVKIADFGISRLQRSVEKNQNEVKKEQNVTGIGGTPLYMPPEMFDLSPNITSKCDVYAYGIILWEIIEQKVPYEGKFNSVVALTMAITKGTRPTLPDKLSPTLKKLITDCWSPSPAARPEFKQILEPSQETFVKIVAEHISSRNDARSPFWMELFKDRSGQIKEEVDWDLFAGRFQEFMGVKAGDERYDVAMKGIALLMEAKSTVKYDALERFLQWFSPLQPISNNGQNTFDEVMTLLRQDWFWGTMSAQQASAKFNAKDVEDGSYLVRFSSNKEGHLTVTYIQNKRKKKGQPPSHMRVPLTPGVPIVSLVEKHVKGLSLKRPLHGRPSEFLALFSNVPTPGAMDSYLFNAGTPEATSLGATPWQAYNVIY